MKKKIFYTILILFLLFFCSTLMIISLISLRDNLSATREKCLSEHYVISSALIGDIQALEERNVNIESAINSLISKYSHYSQGKASSLAFSYKGELIFMYSSPKQIVPKKQPSDLTEQAENQERTVYIEKEPSPTLCIYGNFPAPYQDYGLLYTTDLKESLSSWKKMKNTLFITGMTASLILTMCLGLFLNMIFKPLKQISNVSETIANGEYSRRLNVKGNDEISDMAKNFNNMAGQVEAHIKKLEETAEQKQQFIDNFAHELKTPLTAIYGYAEYIQKANISENERLECTGYIMSECERLQNMAYQLLELATLREIEMEEFEVSELFADSKHIMKLKAKEKNVTLEYKSSDEKITGSRDLLLILINNLVDNAIKASETGSFVNVSVIKDGLHNIIEVKDYGCGMDDEQLSHIKEAFYRVDKARSRESGGAGLGLSICDRIAKLHNAELTFSSVKGKGTTARIIF